MRKIHLPAALSIILQLTRFTDYGLRVLLFVGRQNGRVCTMGEIAAYYRISLEHLRKVVHKATRLGYLNSIRGRNGGVVLGRLPVKVRIGDLVAELESDMSLIDCDALACGLRAGCSLKTLLNTAGRAFVAALNEATLADLLSDRAMKQQFRKVDIEVGKTS